MNGMCQGNEIGVRARSPGGAARACRRAVTQLSIKTESGDAMAQRIDSFEAIGSSVDGQEVA